MGDPTRPRRAVTTREVSTSTVSALARAARLVRTLRHLRGRQLLHLPLQRLRPAWQPTRVAATWSTDRAARAGSALTALGPVAGVTEAERIATAWLDGHFVMLGEEIAWTGDWTMRGPSPLWRYHLHYHEHLADLAWLAARDNDTRAVDRLVADLAGWERAWGEGGAPAWDAYVVSVRVGSWVRILAWAGALLPEATRQRLQDGIATHVEHLAHRFEWHLDGNHLLRNAWALALGSAFFDGPWAHRTAARAQRLFSALMDDQILADGWHVERSPMYHVRALRDAMELEAVLQSVGAPIDHARNAALQRMAAALPWMRRADGSLWLLNDAAQDHGVALAPLNESPAAAEPALGVRHFVDAGTIVVIDEDGDRLRLDVGGPAPAHQPAHAHAGALGFELDLAGVPCIVDRGCSGYDGDPWRSYLRGTAAHSTVMLDGQDQSELWATFRIGGRAAVRVTECVGGARDLTVRAECRAFATRAHTHARTVQRRGRTVTITDEVRGPALERVDGFVHFAPEWEATAVDASTVRVARAGQSVLVRVDGAVRVSLHRGEMHPRCGWQAERFNTVVPAWTLRLTATERQRPRWTITIDPS